MIHLYNQTSFQTSRIITKIYSTSFSLGIKAFHKRFREPIYSIYGFVRIADEIVDTFHGYDKKYLLDKFKRDTFEAIEMGISTNPILNSFQKTVREYKIDKELIEAFLKSMEMDLTIPSHKRLSYDAYVNGSAEVVGLMCLRVFIQDSPEFFEELKPYAQKLGSAFQKVNFLRDIKEDIEERGRIYLPNVHQISGITEFNKAQFEKEIEEEFHEAATGIMKLPAGVRFGVFLAYIYYQALFKKIKGKSIEEIKLKRIRVSNFSKFSLFIKSFFQTKFFKGRTV
ncbi:MAG: phytoene/squalene synthase family protein [Ignavibacteria bacterium]